VAPVVGASTPIFLFIFAFLLLKESLQWMSVSGVLLLIFGGLLISFDLPLRLNKQKFFSGFYYALLSGFLLAAAYVLLKIVYGSQVFLNGFIWTRIGSGIAVGLFFLVPKWRREIISSLKGFRKPKKEHYRAGTLVVLNKIIGGASSILFNFAISLGSVTLVNSLVSSQYVFVLALASGGSLFLPKIYSEKLTFWDWAQKLGAIIIISIGVYLVYTGSMSISQLKDLS
jgi:drug/metabolite transporter (DMT)-like permease